MNERLESIVVQDLIPDVIMMFHFLDALASLDFKLSVTQSVTAQYVNCAAANLALTRECTIASDQYKLSTWTQVPHRELPFRDKGGLRRQGQKRVLFVKDTT